MRRFLRDNGLTLVLLGMFFTSLFGHSVAGHRAYNDDQRSHQESTVSYAKYLTTGAFGESVFENWESEFLQMGTYILLTIWLRQRGSAESKKFAGPEPVDEDPTSHRNDPNAPWPVRRGGVWLAIYRNSLSIAFILLFLGAITGHAITGAHAYSSEQQAHGEAAVTAFQYVNRSQFWFESLQNWQSEFLAVGGIVWLSIYLRQQGSPESKPVHAPHRETGTG
ncbi:MAG: hypothetical protein H0W70_05410 [Actinobacteria bacterium]|nr:hypothetical protein [Actinomycetota bacterium]